MQEGQVGWDPSTIHGPVPWYVRLCLIYLLVIVVIAIIHSVRLSWRLWSLPNRKRLNSDLLASDSFDPDRAAAMVLNGRPETPMGTIEGIARTHLRATRRSVASLAAACREITAGLKRKANYGVAFSLIAVVLQTIDVSKEISTQKIAGVGILAGTPSTLCDVKGMVAARAG